jgi:phytoene synthase
VTPADQRYCEDLLRQHDRDQWLATLFVPAMHRAAVQALYAFDVELRRVRRIVRDTLPGEVRLQWWRDLIGGEARGGAAGNPVAAALEAAIARYGLPRAALERLVDARIQDLYDDPPATMADLEGHLGETRSALMRLTALILADGGEAGTADAPGHGGVALGLAETLRTLAVERRAGRVPLPADLLARHGVAVADVVGTKVPAGIEPALDELVGLAREHTDKTRTAALTLPPSVKPALLPISLVPPLLARIERAGPRILVEPVEVPQWRRQWALWRAARTL